LRRIFKIASLIILLFFASGLNAQTRFGKIECDSFQVTVNEREAIIYQKKKAAVYNRAKQTFLIQPTESSIIYFQPNDLYLVANPKNFEVYNFRYTDTLMPCFEKYVALNQVSFSRTLNGDFYFEQDSSCFFRNNDFLNKPHWIYEPKPRPSELSRIRTEEKKYFSQSIGVERMNDSLILITNYQNDYYASNVEVIKSIQYPEDDSVILDHETGFYNAIYPPPIPGYELSGVFNLSQNNWFIQPTGFIDYHNATGILFREVLRAENGVIGSFSYSFIKIKGEPLFKQISDDDLYLFDRKAHLIADGDTILGTPNFWEHDNSPYRYFNIVKNNEMACLSLNSGYEPITKFKEFVYYNNEYGYYFWLENDSIFAEINGEEYAVSQANGIIDIQPGMIWKNFNYRINLIENGDTVNLEKVTTEIKNERNEPPLKVRIEIIDGILIINDYKDYAPTEIGKRDSFLMEFKDNYIESTYKASSVWRKEGGLWQQKTPYCKSIEKFDFCYVLTHQRCYLDGKYFWKKIYLPETFTLVDNNFNPMEFNGHSLFTNVKITENALELTTKEGNFLIDHQGQLIKNIN
jgi:hypothetical protein